MSVLNRLKTLLIWPMRRGADLIEIGGKDTWSIVDPQEKSVFAVCAGVGLDIGFELGLAERWDTDIILLDPSPTGIQTMERIGPVAGITFKPLGLAAKDGVLKFAKPLDEAEGSFFAAGAEVPSEDLLELECLSLETILRQENKTSIDLLKMDIEGAEYEVLDALLASEISVSQVCVEIHVSTSSGARANLWEAARLIFRMYRNGFRIVYNSAMDFTFVHHSLLR